MSTHEETHGAVFYRPSNGDEGDRFFSQCDDCKHCNSEAWNNGGTNVCAVGIGDRVLKSAWLRDVPAFGLDELKPTCPATCLKRESR